METDIFTNMLILQIILHVKNGHAIDNSHGIPVSNRINLALLSLDSSRIHLSLTEGITVYHKYGLA